MLKIQYRNAKDGGIEVLRCFSQEQQVTIPAQIEGKAVTKIGAGIVTCCSWLKHRSTSMFQPGATKEKKTKQRKLKSEKIFLKMKKNRCFVEKTSKKFIFRIQQLRLGNMRFTDV